MSTVAPARVEIVTTLTPGDFVVYLFKCYSADTVSSQGQGALVDYTWQVQKRYSEFLLLKSQLVRAGALAIVYPPSLLYEN